MLKPFNTKQAKSFWIFKVHEVFDYSHVEIFNIYTHVISDMPCLIHIILIPSPSGLICHYMPCIYYLHTKWFSSFLFPFPLNRRVHFQQEWLGLNLLGYALTEVREAILAGLPEVPMPDWACWVGYDHDLINLIWWGRTIKTPTDSKYIPFKKAADQIASY